MAYTPPSGSAVNFNQTGLYTPPDGGHVNFDSGTGINVSPDDFDLVIESESCLITIGEPVSILPDEFQILLDFDPFEVTVSHYIFPDDFDIILGSDGAFCGVLPDSIVMELDSDQVQIGQTHIIMPDECGIMIEITETQVMPQPEYARPSKLSSGGLSVKFRKTGSVQAEIRSGFGTISEQYHESGVSWADGTEAISGTDCGWGNKNIQELVSAQAWGSGASVFSSSGLSFGQMLQQYQKSILAWGDLDFINNRIIQPYRHPGEVHNFEALAWSEFGHLDKYLEADYSCPPECSVMHETRWGRKYYEKYCIRKYVPSPGDQVNFNLDHPINLVGDGDHVDFFSSIYSYDLRCTHREPSGWRENYTYKPPKGRVPRPPELGVYIVLNSAMLCRLPDRTPIGVLSMSLSSKIDSWCWDFKAVLDTAADLALVKSSDGMPVPVEVEINGWKWVVMIEDSDGSRQFPKGSWSVSGRSQSAWLASPYAPIKTYTEENQRLARQLAEVELENTGWTFDWKIEDWLVPGNVFSVSNQTPMETILKIVRAAGGEIQSHRTEKSLKAISRYPYSPWKWDLETPVISLHESVIVTMGWSNERRPGYNGVYVSGSTAGGVTVFVKRDGSAGEKQAGMIVDPLITAVEAGRERGRVELCKAGNWSRQRLSLPLMAGTELPGLMNCGDLIEVQEGSVLWRGQVSDVTINATRQNGLKVYQNIEVERSHG